MRILLFIVVSFFLTSLVAQEKKSFMQFDLGFGGTAFHIPNTLNLGPKKSFDAASSTIKADLNFYVSKPFSLGISVSLYNFITKGDSVTTFIDARAGSIALMANYHIIDNKKFNWCVGSGIGGNRFGYDVIKIIDSTEVPGNIRMAGNVFMLNTQIRYYFANHIGCFFRTQYVVHGDKITSLLINNKEQDYFNGVPRDKIFYNFRGITIQLGLSLRF